MPAIFVHGVLETGRIWNELVAFLGREDTIVLDLPGFGRALPPAFDPTMDGYAAWLADEIATHDDVDLVGHDWGGYLVLRVMTARPSNVRSWAVDSGDLSPSFVWHDSAQAWQAETGDRLATWLQHSTIDERARMLEGVGVPVRAARSIAAAIDATMTRATLSLYRSATEIGVTWGQDISRIESRGLCVHARHDPYRSADSISRLAARVGAEVCTLDAGHFWMLDQPHEAAERLEQFWHEHVS
jgi:pimeloyl-ACP methyl ester carboxylesterase